MEEVARADLGHGNRILLKAPIHDLYPGETIRGVVELNLTTIPYLVRGAWVKLAGVVCEKAPVANNAPDDEVEQSRQPINIIQLLREDEDFYNGGVAETFIGLGETVDANESDLLELTGTYYLWPFTFKLPSHCPFSYCDDRVEVTYTLTVTLDTPAIARGIGTLTHSIVVGAMTKEDLESQNTHTSTGVLGFHLPCTNSTLAQTPVVKTGMWALLRRAWSLFRPPQPQPYLQLQMEHPAVFSFADTRSVLAIKTVVEKLNILHKYISIRFRVCCDVFVRSNEFTPFDVITPENEEYGKHCDVIWTNEQLHHTGSRNQQSKAKKRNGASLNKLYRTTLWKSEKKLRLNHHHVFEHANQDDHRGLTTIDVPVIVPIVINTAEKAKSLRDWPTPTALAHKLDESAKIFMFTSSSPLTKLRYVLVAELYASSEPLNREPNLKFVCSQTKEILILPPATLQGEHLVSTEGSRALMNGEPMLVDEAASFIQSSSLQADIPRTPQARLAPVRVVAELISRGPAAVLIDQGLRRPRTERENLEHFGCLHPVNVTAATCLAGTPMFSPALAFVCNVNYTSNNAVSVRRTLRRTSANDTENLRVRESNNRNGNDISLMPMYPSMNPYTPIRERLADASSAAVPIVDNPDPIVVVGEFEAERVDLEYEHDVQHAVSRPLFQSLRMPLSNYEGSVLSPSHEEAKFDEDDTSSLGRVGPISAVQSPRDDLHDSTVGVRLMSPVFPSHDSISVRGDLGLLHDAEVLSLPHLQSFEDLLHHVSSLGSGTHRDLSRGSVTELLRHCQLVGTAFLGLSHEKCLALLTCVSSPSEREEVLMFLVREKWLDESALLTLFNSINGCIDHCFDLNMQRERIKSRLRHEILSRYEGFI